MVALYAVSNGRKKTRILKNQNAQVFFTIVPTWSSTKKYLHSTKRHIDREGWALDEDLVGEKLQGYTDIFGAR